MIEIAKIRVYPIFYAKYGVYRMAFLMTKPVYTQHFVPNSVYTQYDRDCQKRCIPNISRQIKCIPNVLYTDKFYVYQLFLAKGAVNQIRPSV